MPTYDRLSAFLHEYLNLTPKQREQFLAAVADMVEDLKAQRPFRSHLRIQRVQKGKKEGVWEMTWAWPDGRATFHYGEEQLSGEVHVIWRRIGGHDIFDNP